MEEVYVYYLKMTTICGYYLMFDISADWPKSAKFVPVNIAISTIEY